MRIRCRLACKRVVLISTHVLSTPISNTSFQSGNAKNDIDGIVDMEAPQMVDVIGAPGLDEDGDPLLLKRFFIFHCLRDYMAG
ncbi:hypothetical protein BHE74_00030705 [Ensete ventricosum]|nr:hypothetical protein BHE74_00030705 [Ensete ventricosum]